MDSSLNALRQALGKKAPEKITQEAFDRDDGHLRRLTRLQLEERPAPADLWAYTQDLLYTDIQGPLLVYVLPFCLQAWKDDLLGVSSEYGGFVEHFYPALADRHVFDMHLKPTQTAAVSEFMRQTILEEIDAQRGVSYQGANARPYRWFYAMASFGVLLPDLELLWTAWWSMATEGYAVAGLQYISCLMYPRGENPIFARWTPYAGGGPPSLWEFGCHLYSHHWLEPNTNFLERFLTPDAVKRALEYVSSSQSAQAHENGRSDAGRFSFANRYC